MSFEYPIFILMGAVITTVLIYFYVMAAIYRNRAMEKFADKELLSEISSALDKRKRKIRTILLIIAVFLAFLSLARPQWGFTWKEIENKGVDVIFAIDTSNSMLAEDITPSRLQRVKLEIEYFIKKLGGDRVGIVAFAGSSFLQCPLTLDYNGFLLNLSLLDNKTVPKEGTAISSAINECVDSYKRTGRKAKIVILITDGEDHEGKAIQAAKRAQAEGLKIFCIGIGSSAGSSIPTTDKNGKKSMLCNKSGEIVISKLDDRLLKKIAFITGGTYLQATETHFGLEQLYKERLSQIKNEAEKETVEKIPNEKFQAFLSLMLVILLIEPFISERKNSNA